MASDAKDPREAVLDRQYLMYSSSARTLLRDLDAADPLRAMLLEVVEGLEYIARATYGTELSQTPEEQLAVIWGHFSDSQRKARALLTRLRTLTPTEGDAQEPEATATRIRDPQFCFEDRLKTGLPCTEPDWRGGNYGSVICRTREHHRNPTEGGTDDGE